MTKTRNIIETPTSQEVAFWNAITTQGPENRFFYADWLEDHSRQEDAMKQRELVGDFVQKIEITPAWDKTHEDPKKNRGIHGVELRMVLIGPAGAVQFVLYTNWLLSMISNFHSMRQEDLIAPMPADLGYHAKRPMYEDQLPLHDNCPYTGGMCYYDGSRSNADKAFNVLIAQGDEGLWKFLKNYYRDTFEGGE